jgi:DNA-binding transcriptional MerR regulator
MSLTVSNLGAEVGLSAATVRYYERLGLLPAPERTAAGYRQYPKDAIERLRFIKSAQRVRLRLREIAEQALLDRDEHHRSPPSCCRPPPSATTCRPPPTPVPAGCFPDAEPASRCTPATWPSSSAISASPPWPAGPPRCASSSCRSQHPSSPKRRATTTRPRPGSRPKPERPGAATPPATTAGDLKLSERQGIRDPWSRDRAGVGCAVRRQVGAVPDPEGPFPGGSSASPSLRGSVAVASQVGLLVVGASSWQAPMGGCKSISAPSRSRMPDSRSVPSGGRTLSKGDR